jgi:hypothetical protein
VVPPQGELRVDPILDRGQTQLLQARDRRLGERVVGEIRERRAAPQCQSVVEQTERTIGLAVLEGPMTRASQPFEPLCIHLLAFDAEHVAGRLRDQHLGRRAGQAARLQDTAQLPHIHLERLGGSARSALPPDVVHQQVGGDNLAVSQEQRRQNGLLLRPSKRDRTAAVPYFQPPEKSKVHGAPPRL